MEHDPHGPAPAVVDVALELDGTAIAALWLRTVRGELLMGRVRSSVHSMSTS